MLIYIHVPFCRTRCRYCAFHSEALGRSVQPENSERVRTYVDTLLMEISLWAERLGGRKVETIFFGGGTPSLLSAHLLGIILERLHKYFAVEENAEITLECNPESLNGTLHPSQYLKAGFNRLSIGIQSLDGDMLRLLGRAHKVQDSLYCLQACQDAGFVNLNCDLMWGLPGQSVRQWLQSLKDIVRLGPTHISAYGLTLEPGTRLEQGYKKGLFTLPPEWDQKIMFLEGGAYLESQGFLQYEISNFARMGYSCRHNLGYWQGAEYLGFGPSATSTIGETRITNPAHLETWSARINSGLLGGEEEHLTPLVRVLEMIMLRLRTARGLELKSYRDLTGHDFLQDHQKMVQGLHENGLIRILQGHLRLTPNGMLVSNAILSHLFEQTKKVLQGAKIEVPKQTNAVPIDEQPQVRTVVWPRL